ncbi:MAG: hypothetical protein JXJ20_13195 [Anaerolineae bacterium]|nr:hypothetical protein [Anaerolineae bacterium]
MASNGVLSASADLATSNRVGFYAGIATSIITIITFGLAMFAIPISGANCPSDCIQYPYLDTEAQFPRDYLWMIPAMLLTLGYVILMVSIHAYAPPQRKIFSQISLAFAIIAAMILIGDYYVQFSVVPVSVKNDETEGIALLTQYNSHGLFVALEEAGYLMMSLSFLFMAPVFAVQHRLASAIRWVFILGFVLPLVSLILISAAYGLERLDRFEVVVLSVDWLVLVVNGILLSLVFRNQLKEETG